MGRKAISGILLALVMAMSLAACGKEEPKEKTPEEVKENIPVPVSHDYRKYTYENGNRVLVQSGSVEYDEQGRILHARYNFDLDKVVACAIEYIPEYDELGRVDTVQYETIPFKSEIAVNGDLGLYLGAKWIDHFTYHQETTIVTSHENQFLSEESNGVVRYENEVSSDGVILGRKLFSNNDTFVIAEYDEEAQKVIWHDDYDFFGYEQSTIVKYEEYYDAEGKLIRVKGFRGDTLTVDPDMTTTYTYDRQGRLEGNQSVALDGKVIGTMKYDGQGRVIFRDNRENLPRSVSAEEEHTVWELGGEAGGRPGKVAKCFTVDASAGESVLTGETRYLKKMIDYANTLLGVDAIDDKLLFFENGKYYCYEPYYSCTIDGDEKTVTREAVFSEDGRIQKESYFEPVSEDSEQQVWVTLEYDEHENILKKWVRAEDGTDVLTEEYEYEYHKNQATE
ncbi:MAG: RHS repeat protein [Lachnospiraceae bacterium]|nr:RHS repeat protein [Lachnospiraceae bacterium]